MSIPSNLAEIQGKIYKESTTTPGQPGMVIVNPDGTNAGGGGGGGSTGVADKSAFTNGTTLEQPSGGVFQSSPDTITSGTTAALAIDNHRNVQVTQTNGILSSQTLQNAATATGNGTVFTVTGYSALILTVSGTFVGTITFEGTEDGTNWSSLSMVQLGTNTIASTTTTTGLFETTVSGLASVRARISAYTSGSITVTGHASPLAWNPKVINADMPQIIAGENLSTNRLNNEPVYSFTYISTATTTTVKSGAGTFSRMIVNGGTTGTITIYDNTAASGTQIAVFDTTNAISAFTFDASFATGLTIVTSAATKLSVMYR